MKKKHALSVVLMLVVLTSLLFLPTTAHAGVNCQCVGYVKNYFGIIESTGNAKDMGAWFLNHGFTAASSPVVGAVAVMQPGFPSVDPTYGHVGIVDSYSDQGSNWKIYVRGANQGSSNLFSEFRCDNVRVISWTYAKSNTKIKYYTTPKYALRSAVSGSSSLYFDIYGGSANDGANVVGWSYHGGNNQLFNFIKYGSEYKIIARNSGKCIRPQSTGQGAKLIQNLCNGSGLEKWQVITSSPGVILKNSQTGYVADLAGGSLTPGTSILIWSSHGGANQKWIREAK